MVTRLAVLRSFRCFTGVMCYSLLASTVINTWIIRLGFSFLFCSWAFAVLGLIFEKQILVYVLSYIYTYIWLQFCRSLCAVRCEPLAAVALIS